MSDYGNAQHKPEMHISWTETGELTVACAGGWVRAVLDGARGVGCITDVFVAPPRHRGLGTALLRATAVTLAATGKCTRVWSDVTTLPCADAMRRVFGAAAVNVLCAPETYRSDDETYVPRVVAFLNAALPLEK